MNYDKPTPIQEKTIPLALEGKDILGSAQTGTGKTAAFGIPLIVKLLADPNSSALVLTPTRELADQVLKQLRQMLGQRSKVQTALLIGGDPMPKQLQQLKRNPQLVVGTPGRVNDHLKRKSLSLTKTNFLVLDETDRMLDMGFSIQIDEILTHMKPKRQTLLFSATLAKKIAQIAEKYLKDPARVSVSSTTAPATNIKQENVYVTETEKYDKLCAELEQRNGSIIVFVKTKYNADKMSAKLSKQGFDTDAIHGDLRQNKRERVLNNFRKKKYRVLIATDVAARGLDVPHIEHVINYDLPQSPEDYVHRIGRTARAGASGEALNFISNGDKAKWHAIEHFIDPESRPPRTKVQDKKGKKPFKKNFSKNSKKPFLKKNKPKFSPRKKSA
ncbi:MAG: ATP-dependent RNA helicase [Rickettsiales bacterium]|nr:ATP-dependent RNA helicase [Rickettsiales bacterium]|tara:strand:- start:2322 stop:3482 length:1161 start_codon:yes stop_codon:yes gene_type:complete